MRSLHLAAIASLFLLYLVPTASAHAFGSFNEIPIPLYLYYFGGAAVVAVSFIVISLFVKESGSRTDYRKYDVLSYGYIGNIFEIGYLSTALKLASIFLVLLIVLTGLFGDQVAVFNFAPIFVWIVWWVGSAFVHVFIGNLWQVTNPWKAVLDWARRLNPNSRPPFRYRREIGVWPAFIAFFCFVWIELVFPNPEIPMVVALLTVIYSAVTLAGMGFFGPNVWMRYCDPFSVFFYHLSLLAPTEVRVTDPSICGSCELGCETTNNECVNCYECYEHAKRQNRELNLRPFAAGLLSAGHLSIDRVAFILLMLAGISFDGLSRTFAWHSLVGIDTLAQRSSIIWINTLGLAGVFLLFLSVYMAISWLAKIVAEINLSPMTIALGFAVSLLPIAMVYQLAHYSIFLFVNGQQIIRLASDPFGYGWNLFGTASFPVNTNLNFLIIWNYEVGLIVPGHVIAVYMAHRLSLNLFRSVRSAVRSQYPMILLMIAYTSAGLWLLSAPGVG